MAVTVPVADVLLAARVVADTASIPDPVSKVAGLLYPAASAIIEQYAPLAPEGVQNAAMVRLFAWLWDADSTDPALGRALQVSGTAALLSQWRVHRAGAIGQAGETPAPAPGPGNVPTPPADGHYILTSVNGVLTWVLFPAPS